MKWLPASIRIWKQHWISSDHNPRKIDMKNILLACLIICSAGTFAQSAAPTDLPPLAQDVRNETLRAWQSYEQYAWGHDALKPLSKGYEDWYSEPLYISPIDAYSTLYMMGFTEETRRIEQYVSDSLNFDKDIEAKVFEVNIRILGGLLSMYELSGNPKVLDKARDFGDRMLPAFSTPTSIPTYWVNLRTGETSGNEVNVAEAATYTFEMGILSYYTQDPKYYQAGKKATKAIFDRRSEIGLIGDVIDVQTGKWTSENSHICAGVDSYYEYLYKSYLLFGDEELGTMWDASIDAIQKYIAEEYDGKLWYGRVNMHTGVQTSTVITLYDAFFLATLALSGDMERAVELQNSWHWLWAKYGLEPMAYDYKKDKVTYPVYDLNPEIMESACYLYHLTGDSTWLRMNEEFWNDIKTHCGTDAAFTRVLDVTTMQQGDYMATYFFAETLKYLYLTFAGEQSGYTFFDYLYNTEAHPFLRSHFDHEKAGSYLGFSR